MNPEFLRNVWLELSPQRLLFMPVLLGIIFGLIVVDNSDAYDSGLSYWSVVLFFILAGIWGPKRARDAFLEETRQGTWDTQRMSALSPWELTWGKLLGSTIYVWYAAGICLAVFLLSDTGGAGLTSDNWVGDPRALELRVKLQYALLFFCQCLFLQSLAAAAGLLSLRSLERAGVIGVALVLVVWVAFFEELALLSLVLRKWRTTIHWWGIAFHGREFVLLSTMLLCFWSVVALWRLIAQELRVYSLPYAWFGFCLCLILWVLGLPDMAKHTWANCLGVSALILLALAYFAALLEPRDPLLLQRLLRLGRAGEYTSLLRRLPSSFPTLLIAILLIVFSRTLPLLDAPAGSRWLSFFNQNIFMPLPLIIGVLGVRDFAILQFYVLGTRPDRALVNFGVALFCLDVLAPLTLGLLSGFEDSLMGGVIFPYTSGFDAAPITLPAAILHACIAVVLLYWRWQHRCGLAATATPSAPLPQQAPL